jgi:hypothetical protein
MLLIVDLLHRQGGVNEGQDLFIVRVLGQKRVPALDVGLDPDDDRVRGALGRAGGGARGNQKGDGENEPCSVFHRGIVAVTTRPSARIQGSPNPPPARMQGAGPTQPPPSKVRLYTQGGWAALYPASCILHLGGW